MINDLHFRRYDRAWPERLMDLRDALRQRVPERVVIEHVGSTAVPGLSAKDCIDMLIVVDPSDRAVTEAALEGLGYELRPDSFAEDPTRWFWRLIFDDRRFAHAHLMLAGNSAAVEMLAVRDLLRTDPTWREAYQDLKLSLAAADEHNRPAYLTGKAEFVRRMTDAALVTHRSRVDTEPTLKHHGRSA